MPHTIRGLPVHDHYTANDYNLSALLLMFWKILVSSKLFIVYRTHVQPSSCSLPKLGSAKSRYLRSRSRNYLPPPQPSLYKHVKQARFWFLHGNSSIQGTNINIDFLVHFNSTEGLHLGNFVRRVARKNHCGSPSMYFVTIVPTYYPILNINWSS
jgi:hypothetical protein